MAQEIIVKIKTRIKLKLEQKSKLGQDWKLGIELWIGEDLRIFEKNRGLRPECRIQKEYSWHLILNIFGLHLSSLSKIVSENFLFFNDFANVENLLFFLIGWMLFSWGLGFARFYCHYWISDIWHRVVPSYGFAELSAPSGNWLSGKNSSSTFSYRECNFASTRARSFVKTLQPTTPCLEKCILKAIHQIKCRKCPFTAAALQDILE